MKDDKSTLSVLFAFLAGMAVMWVIHLNAQQKLSSTGVHSITTTSASAPANAGAVRVDLHVMAQCPYGVQAEAAFKDVVAKFGPDLDLHVDYIGQTGADGELTSMHGPNEVKGDLLQVCAQKYAPAKAFDFVLCQNENSREVATNGAACAAKVGAPADKIVACADGPEGKELLTASFKRSRDKGASGSPTIFIGGTKYDGGRKPVDFMKGVCNSGGKKPAGCATIPESPKVNVTLLSDTRCGTDCDPRRLEGNIRNKVGNPIITNVDYATPEGARLFGIIKPVSLPAAIFDATLDADKDAVAAFSRGLKAAGDLKVMSMGGWNPVCSDEGGCSKDECKKTMQCRVEVPKKLEVFVMAQCPYGVKGLDAMKEVVENFKKAGDPIDFSVHYIGDGTAAALTSMHGAGEVEEDIRESCAIQHYGKNLKFMDYVWCRDKSIRDPNWQACTGAATGIDTDVIKKCAEEPGCGN